MNTTTMSADPTLARGGTAAGGRLLTPLWLALAATFPLFAIEALRLNNDTLRVHLAVPMILLAMILVVVCGNLVAGVARPTDTRRRWVHHSDWEWALFGSLGCLVAWHAVGWARVDEWVLPTRELAKVAIGAFSVWVIMTSFPREPGSLERFWRIVIYASAILVALLIAEYGFLFNYPYLGNNVGGVPNTYSIQLAWYLTPVMLYAGFYVADVRRKSLAFLALVVFATGWLYVSSRASWLAVGAGFLAAVPAVGYKRSLSYLAPIAAAVAVALLFLCLIVPAQVAFPRRALFLVSPASVPELHSYEIRAGLFMKTWSCFMTSPLTGIGLGATDTCIQFETHNDYMRVLSDLGIVGLGIFLAVLGVVAAKVLPLTVGGTYDWLSLGGRASLVALAVMMCFHNLYTTTFSWILLGLLCVEAGSRQERADVPPGTPEVSGVVKR